MEAFLKSGRKRDDFARLWGCSPSCLDKWVRRYREEGTKGLENRVPARGQRRPHPKRVPEEVHARIEAVAREHSDFGAHRVADHLARFCGLSLSPGTVRKILRERGIPGQPAGRRRARAKSHLPRRFERALPCELWQSEPRRRVKASELLGMPIGKTPDDAGEEDRVPGAGAGAHGGPGPRAENGPLADGELGISREGRAPSWQSDRQEAEAACRARSGCESRERSAAAAPRRRSWRWWLRRSE